MSERERGGGEGGALKCVSVGRPARGAKHLVQGCHWSRANCSAATEIDAASCGNFHVDAPRSREEQQQHCGSPATGPVQQQQNTTISSARLVFQLRIRLRLPQKENFPGPRGVRPNYVSSSSIRPLSKSPTQLAPSCHWATFFSSFSLLLVFFSRRSGHTSVSQEWRLSRNRRRPDFRPPSSEKVDSRG